eukprot:ANDGO_03479.mRNA.1 putative fucosyltransferase 9
MNDLEEKYRKTSRLWTVLRNHRIACSAGLIVVVFLFGSLLTPRSPTPQPQVATVKRSQSGSSRPSVPVRLPPQRKITPEQDDEPVESEENQDQKPQDDGARRKREGKSPAPASLVKSKPATKSAVVDTISEAIEKPVDESTLKKAAGASSSSTVMRHPVLQQIIDKVDPIDFLPPMTDALLEKLEYWRQIQLAATGKPSSAKWDGKLVRCSPSAQMGNRVRFTLACFFFALVTDRALSVEFLSGFYASLDDLFDLPAPLEATAVGAPAAGTWGGTFPGSEEDITCSDLKQRFKDVGSVQFSGSGAYYFAPHIWHNPHHHDELLALFPDERFIDKLTWWLLPPNKQVWQIVRDVYDAHLSDSTFIIGQQIRSNCPPEPKTFISDAEFQSHHDCAVEITPKEHRKTAKWYVAADSGNAIKDSMEKLEFDGAVFRWKPDEFVLSGDPTGVRQALADIMLLAVSDEMIMSTWSSYGQMAATYHLKPSYWVSDYGFPLGNDYALQEEVLPHCYRLLTTEYSARQYTEFVSHVSCFTKDMAPSWWL